LGIYLDNSATSFPKPECVYAEMDYFMRNNGASPGRGNYAKAMEAGKLVYETRKVLAKLLGIKKPGQIIFTNNVTESLNMVLKGFLANGDTVLTSNIEHNAMWRPLKNLEKERQIRINQFRCTAEGKVDLQEIKEKLRQDTKLLAMVHGSNVLGNVLPLADIIALAHEKDVPVLVDAAQTAGVYPLDLERLGVDFFAFTGHKGLLGPTGTGGLYLREGLQLKTFKEGGTGSMAKSPFQPQNSPDRFEAGTMNTFGLAGLKAAANFLLAQGVEQIRAHDQKLIAHLRQGLAEQIPRAKVYGPPAGEEQLGLISLNIAGINPYDLALRLDEQFGIMVRAGLHCAPQAHQALGTLEVGAVRVSVGYFNTVEHMEQLLEALIKISK